MRRSRGSGIMALLSPGKTLTIINLSWIIDPQVLHFGDGILA
jgi:hypothetical protein